MTAPGEAPQPAAAPPSSLGAFLRLCLVMILSFFGAKVLFNLAVMGWIDLRPVAFEELVLVPLVQSVMFWFITRRGRDARSPV